MYRIQQTRHRANACGPMSTCDAFVEQIIKACAHVDQKFKDEKYRTSLSKIGYAALSKGKDKELHSDLRDAGITIIKDRRSIIRAVKLNRTATSPIKFKDESAQRQAFVERRLQEVEAATHEDESAKKRAFAEQLLLEVSFREALECERYKQALNDPELKLEQLKDLDEADLQALGIIKREHRKEIHRRLRGIRANKTKRHSGSKRASFEDAERPAPSPLPVPDLYDLNASDLAQWIRLLPEYKAGATDGDRAMCKQISHFVFEQQIRGQCLSGQFDEEDFRALLNCLNVQWSHATWIWHCIHQAQAH